MKTMGMAAALAAMTVGAAATAQTGSALYDDCAAAARKTEADGKAGCTQTIPMARANCIERAGQTLSRAMTKCVTDENRRLEAANARAKQAADAARLRAAQKR